MFLVQPIYGSIADKWGIKKMLQISFFGTAVCFIGYQYTTGILSILFSTTLMSFFYNGLQPFLDSLALQLEAKDKSFSYGSLRMAAVSYTHLDVYKRQTMHKLATRLEREAPGHAPTQNSSYLFH